MAGEQYDVIVVGAGLGGLTAAALLAKAGRSVLVLEAEPIPGGFAASLEWEGRRFDRAVHLIMGAGTPSKTGQGILTNLLTELGVADECELVRADPFFRAVLPGMDVIISGSGTDGFVASHAERFPHQERALRELLATCREIHRETLQFPVVPRLWHRLLAPVRFPHLVRNLRASLKDALDRHGFDPDMQALLGALWMYLGLPPSKVSFLVWASMTANMVEEGAFYSVGGFERIGQALCRAVEESGGEIRTSTRVHRILTDGPAARGVEVADGQRIHAPIVVSNVDARRTARGLVGEEHLPSEYVERIDRMRPSVSVVALYTVVPSHVVPDGSVHETVVFSTQDLEAVYRDGLGGRISGVTVTIPSLSDDGLAAPGEHLVIVKGMVPREGEPPPVDAPAQLAECARPVLPELGSHLGIEPERPLGDRSRYTLHQMGPIYGWDRAPDQVGPFGLGNVTPVGGLYLCGHWSLPGAGVRTVVISGIRVARLILGRRLSHGVAPRAKQSVA